MERLEVSLATIKANSSSVMSAMERLEVSLATIKARLIVHGKRLEVLAAIRTQRQTETGTRKAMIF
jgi:hypothetical protein